MEEWEREGEREGEAVGGPDVLARRRVSDFSLSPVQTSVLHQYSRALIKPLESVFVVLSWFGLVWFVAG